MSSSKNEEKKVFIDYREFIQYPDAKVTDLFLKHGLDPNRPHDIVYNQSLRRYEITQHPSSSSEDDE